MQRPEEGARWVWGGKKASVASPESAHRGLIEEVRQGFYCGSTGKPLDKSKQVTDRISLCLLH